MGQFLLGAFWDNIHINMKFLVLASLAVVCSARPQFLFLVPGTGDAQSQAAPTLTQEQISNLQRNLQALLPQIIAQSASADATATATAAAASAAAVSEVAAAP